MLSVYLSASWSRRPEMKKLTAELEREIPGLYINARWIKVEPPDKTFWQRSKRENTRLAVEDRDDAIASDVLVRFSDDLSKEMVPAHLATGSRMVEMGLKLRAHEPVIVVGGKQNLFDELPEVQHVRNVAALKRLLKRIVAASEGKVCHISPKRLARLLMTAE